MILWRSWSDHPIFDHGLIIVMGPGELRGGWEQQDEAPAGGTIIISTAIIPICWQIIFCIVCNCIVFVSTWTCICTKNKMRLPKVEQWSFWSYLWHWPANILQLFLFANIIIFYIVCYYDCFFGIHFSMDITFALKLNLHQPVVVFAQKTYKVELVV